MARLNRIVTTFVLLTTGFVTSASADTYHHIDELALHIAKQSRELLSETRHYRHTPEYRHLVSDAKDLYRLADHLHDVAHRHGSLHHMESDLRDLDRHFHHLESVVERIEHAAEYGHGHVHGRTSHVRCLLRSMENNIHHLQDDIRELRGASHRAHRPIYTAPVYSRPVYTRPTYHRPVHAGNPWGRSFSFGGGSTRFSLRF